MMGGSGTKALNWGWTSQLIRLSGKVSRRAAAKGRAWITSPRELILMIRMFW